MTSEVTPEPGADATRCGCCALSWWSIGRGRDHCGRATEDRLLVGVQSEQSAQHGHQLHALLAGAQSQVLNTHTHTHTHENIISELERKAELINDSTFRIMFFRYSILARCFSRSWFRSRRRTSSFSTFACSISRSTFDSLSASSCFQSEGLEHTKIKKENSFEQVVSV